MAHFCPHCHREVEPEATRCPDCGESFLPASRSPGLFGCVFGFFGLVGAGILFLVYVLRFAARGELKSLRLSVGLALVLAVTIVGVVVGRRFGRLWVGDVKRRKPDHEEEV